VIAEAVAAGVIAVVILYLVLQPLLRPSAPVAAPWEPPEAEETARGRALLALKEIAFDRATGKLSDDDFATLEARYERAAILTFDGCARCGRPMRDRDRYCGACGTAR
jgi:hypothetical protein